LVDLEDELIADIFMATKEAMKILKKAPNPDAFKMTPPATNPPRFNAPDKLSKPP